MYIIIGTSNCPGCIKAEEMLKEKEALYIKQNIDELEPVRKLAWSKFLSEELNTNSVPQVLKYVGGTGDLERDLVKEIMLLELENE